MNRYTTVEDYLEVIAGLRDPVTLKTKAQSWLNDFDPIVNLARYDTDVLNSMSTTASDGRALTEKQGELAVKIVLKYKRQLAAKGVDVTPVEEQARWRLPLRVMDYTRKLSVVHDQILVTFPFNSTLIEDLRDFRKESQGAGAWDKDAKVWSFALTEYNLVWLTTWAEQNTFEIDPEVRRLNALIAEVETRPYAIQLQYRNNQLTIENCPDSLQEHVENTLGGFGVDNLLHLIDMSAVLGYTVSKEIADQLLATSTRGFYYLATGRELKLDPTAITDDLACVLDYADEMQRWPVVVYEPDLSGKLLAQLRTLREGVVEVPRTLKVNESYWEKGFRYIHVSAPITHLKIPLLISSAGMMFGGDKSLMVQNAEKIVYCAAEVYNKRDTKVPHFAS
jgi:hypothetical protein